MHVKRKMVAGILLTAVLSINTGLARAQNSTFNNAVESISRIANAFNQMFDRLSDEDMQKYYGALFTALNNLDNGEVARWYGDRSGNHGTVEIVATLPNGGQLCRRVYVNVVTAKGNKNFESWACMDGKEQWSFSYR